MAALTAQQIAQYAYNAGFRGAALNQAVAIALAESGGNPQAYNPELSAGTASGSGSRGLWQIYGTAHPEYNNPSVFDPQANANAAFKVFREAGNRFSPWSTYNLGMAKPTADYSKMIQPGQKRTITQTTTQAKNPVQNIARGVENWQQMLSLPSVNSAIAADQEKPTTGILKSIQGLLNRDPSDYGFITLGFVFVVIGLVFLFVAGTIGFAKSDAGQTVIKTAAAAAL